MRISDWSSDVCSSDLLRAERLPLAIGAPDPARIAAAIGSRPERDRIYAAIGLAAGDVGRAGDVGAGMMPRHAPGARAGFDRVDDRIGDASRSEEHTSELQSLMRSSYAVFCLKKKNT